MTGTPISENADVQAVKSAAGSLPEEGKTEVLCHLVSDMTEDAIRALYSEAREKLLQVLASTEAATLPAPEIAPIVSVEEMKQVLRAEDCLYDNEEIWMQLGAKEVPAIPDSVIREAYEKGGRVVLRCSSMREKAEVLRGARHTVEFWGKGDGLWERDITYITESAEIEDRNFKENDFKENVPKPEWIVIQSHIDLATLGTKKRYVVTTDKPAPTPEDWFAALAYAKLDGYRQPKGCHNMYAFTAKDGTVVGSNVDLIDVATDSDHDRNGNGSIGLPRFGPPRIKIL
jgi:hypothetical protein